MTTAACWRPDEDGRPDHPDHLGGAYDWMSVPHERLFQMVHDKLNVEVGTAAAADWARLGEELTDLGDELAELVRDTADAWEGPAAVLVEDCVGTLARWARHTGGTATEVSGCVAIAVDNAAHARDAMPPPVEVRPAAMPDAARAFTSGGFESAPVLLVDQQNDVLDRMNARHAEAARVMDQFQTASRDVYRTVPRFAPPDPARRPKRRADGEPAESAAPYPTSAATTASAAASADPRPPAGGGGPGAGGASAAGGGGSAGPGDLPKSGMSVTATPRGGGAGLPTPSGPERAPASASGMGALPMGGGAGVGRDTDHERRGLDFLEERGFWDCPDGDLMVSAAVIGEVRRHE